jgi:ribonuclease Z
MPFSLVILGSSSAIPAHGRGLSAQALSTDDKSYLIDCGEGTQFRLIKNRIRISKLNQIFISHLHGDHVFGLPGLLSTMSMLGRQKKLQIFSPPGLSSMIQSVFEMSETFPGFELEFNTLDTSISKKIFSDKNIDVYSIPLDHRIPCCGYKFIEKVDRNIERKTIQQYGLNFQEIRMLKKGRDITTEAGIHLKSDEVGYFKRLPHSFAYVSDSRYNPSVVAQIKGVDLLFHEVTYSHDLKDLARQRMHSTAKEAARIAAQAKVGKLVIGHFSSRYKDPEPLLQEAKSIFPNSFLGLDSTKFEWE